MAISRRFGKKVKTLVTGGPYHGKYLMLSGGTFVFSVNGMRGRYVNARWEDV